MGRKRAPKEQPICVYCGANPATTGDHVVPKCLFIPPLPQDVVVVPACRACNEDKSQDDSYLRDILVMDYQGSENPVAREIFQTKVMRSAKRNRSDAVRTAMRQARSISLFSPSGLYLGRLPSFDLDEGRINRIFSYIIRGLYYKTVRERLPNDCSIGVRRVNAKDANDVFHIIKGLGGNGPYDLGKGIFTCAFMYATEEPVISFWLLWFYQKVFFIADTAPRLVNGDALGN